MRSKRRIDNNLVRGDDIGAWDMVRLGSEHVVVADLMKHCSVVVCQVMLDNLDHGVQFCRFC